MKFAAAAGSESDRIRNCTTVLPCGSVSISAQSRDASADPKVPRMIRHDAPRRQNRCHGDERACFFHQLNVPHRAPPGQEQSCTGMNICVRRKPKVWKGCHGGARNIRRAMQRFSLDLVCCWILAGAAAGRITPWQWPGFQGVARTSSPRPEAGWIDSTIAPKFVAPPPGGYSQVRRHVQDCA